MKYSHDFEIHSGEPPVGNARSTNSPWKDLFEEMKVGQWFIVGKEDLVRARSAGTQYLRGRHMVRKHKMYEDVWVFVKTK